MKSLFTIFILASFIFTSCTVNEKPEYLGVENVQIESFKDNKITLTLNAKFNNKNSIGGKITSDNMQVFANNIMVGTIVAEEFTVHRKDTFSVPLRGVFSADKLLAQKTGDLLSQVMNVLSNREMDVGIKGVLTFKKGVFKYNYKVDKNERINFGF